MLNRTVAEIHGFKRDRAFELLKLIQEAHFRYNDLYPSSKRDKATRKRNFKKEFDHMTPASKKWSSGGWETDFDHPVKVDHFIGDTPQPAYKEITSSPYQVLAHLIFTQTVWSATDLKNGFKRKNLFGFIARHQETSDIYVVFRGTSNPGEWISNVKLIQQSYTTIKNRDTPGEAHWGFRRTYDRPETYDKSEHNQTLWVTRVFDQILLKGASSMRETVEATLKKECPANSKKVNIYVTGHSLGGALATLATAHIKKLIEQEDIFAHNPILYSFASPRVGDVEFAKAFDQIECYRVANSEDLVPKVPLPTLIPIAGRAPARTGILQGLTFLLRESLDFQHIGVPIYFTCQEKSISDNHTLPVYFEALK